MKRLVNGQDITTTVCLLTIKNPPPLNEVPGECTDPSGQAL